MFVQHGYTQEAVATPAGWRQHEQSRRVRAAARSTLSPSMLLAFLGNDAQEKFA